MYSQKGKKYLIVLVVIGALIALVVFFVFRNNNGSPSSKNTLPTYRSYRGLETNNGIILSRDEAISEHWDEIKEYVEGTETVDACSYESGNCYSLDADISVGSIEEIYFPKGGELYFSADIDEYGNASDVDSNGNNWDLTIDMDSSIIDDAIYDWANDNGYEIE